MRAAPVASPSKTRCGSTVPTERGRSTPCSRTAKPSANRRRTSTTAASLRAARRRPNPSRPAAKPARSMSHDDIRETVRRRYAAAAGKSAVGEYGEARAAETSCCDPVFGADLYTAEDLEGAPEAAVAASLGCGVPTAVADLHPGET